VCYFMGHSAQRPALETRVSMAAHDDQVNRWCVDRLRAGNRENELPWLTTEYPRDRFHPGQVLRSRKACQVPGCPGLNRIKGFLLLD
jgi:hypothetical protein